MVWKPATKSVQPSIEKLVWKYIFLMHLSSLQTGTACTLDIGTDYGHPE